MTTIRERYRGWNSFRGQFLHPTMEQMTDDIGALIDLVDQMMTMLEPKEFGSQSLGKDHKERILKHIRDVVG